MKLQKSAKLAVTAGLALSMTLGVAAPVVASAATTAAEAEAEDRDLTYVAEDGVKYFQVGEGNNSLLIPVSDKEGKVYTDQKKLAAVQEALDAHGAKHKFSVVQKSDGSWTFIALVKSGNHIALQTEEKEIVVSDSKGNIDENSVNQAKSHIAGFLGVDESELNLNIKNGSLTCEKQPSAKYHALFYANGGTFDGGVETMEVAIASNGKITQPKAPTREGYKFTGWAFHKDGSDPVDFSKPVLGKNATLFAQWEKAEEPSTAYQVLMVANGGVLYDGSETLSMSTDSNGKLPKTPDPTREGYAFKGWAFHATPFNEKDWWDGEAAFAGNATLFAQWEKVPVEYQVTFNANGGKFADGNGSMSVSTGNGGKITLPLAPTRDGYTFAGWTYDKAGERPYAKGDVVTADTTLFAQWKSNDEAAWGTAVFYDEDGTTVLTTAGYEVGKPLPAWPYNVPEREGYELLGFSIKGSDEIVKDPKTLIMPAGGLEFVAHWEKVAEPVQWATATFYDEDGTTVLGTADYQVSKALGVWAVTPAPRDGYTFKGYAIQGKESDGVVDPTTVAMSADGMSFVAVWEKNAPDAQWAKATFLDADGKTVIGTADYQIGEALNVWAVTPAPRRGYCFKGYYIATKPDTIVNPRKVTMSATGMTFVAVWQKISVPTPNPNPTPTPNPNPTPTPTPKPDKPFEDVAANMWYAKPIAQAKKLGYVNGDATTGLFYPQRSITRADAVCILFNMAGGKNMPDDLFSKDGGKTFESGFSDVSGDAYYAKALAWAKKTGVANGYGDGTFKPGQEISREEFAALLSNYAKLKGDYKAPTKDLSSFNDASSVSDWAKTAVAWAVENEVMGNGGFLAGQSDITRAEVAAMAVNYQPEAVKTPVDGK